MKLSLIIFLTLTTLQLSSLLNAQQLAIPGQFPPKEIQQKVRPLLKEIRAAQIAKNEKLVLQLADTIIQHLGPWAANPDNAPTYHSPINSQAPNQQELFELWEKINSKVIKNALWVEVPDGNPDLMTSGLRQAARPIISNATMYNIIKDKQPETLKFITSGANYLLKLQRENGLFPAPDLRGDDQAYTSFNKRTLKKNPDALVEGWFVDDYRGELQLDHAVSGIAMLQAYRLTKDQRYLASVIAAANWAISKDLDTNWSYNAYSSWLLAETYQQTGQSKYLFHAVEKLKLGVLPGLLKSGRWFDPINARLIYHAANVRGMIAVHRNLPQENPFKKDLKINIEAALNNASQQILQNGASSTTTSTEMLVEALKEFGERETWRKALNININAGLDAAHGKGDSGIGVFLPSYIEFTLQANN